MQYEIHVNGVLATTVSTSELRHLVSAFDIALEAAALLKGKEDTVTIRYGGSRTHLTLLSESDPRDIWMRQVYLPYFRDADIDPGLSEAEVLDARQLDCFLADTGRYPRDGEELDAYTHSEEQWAAYKAAHCL